MLSSSHFHTFPLFLGWESGALCDLHQKSTPACATPTKMRHEQIESMSFGKKGGRQLAFPKKKDLQTITHSGISASITGTTR